MRELRYALFGALTIGLAACQDPLNVTNPNNPDRGRVFGNAADLEQLIASTYARAHAGTLGGATVLTGGGNDALQPQLQVMGGENVSSLANFAMGPRGAIPRNAITNSRGSQGNIGNYRDWVVEHSAARMAALGIARLKTLTLGSAARDARALAFARFAQGVALGNLALAYDSASILTENDNPEATATVIVPLSGYHDVMKAALGYLESAIAIASGAQPAGPPGDWFPLPNTWINTSISGERTAAQFVQLAKSYQARFLAGVARDTIERAAVDWSAVRDDALAGFGAPGASDFNIFMDPTNGWDVSWVIQHYASANWHQMSQFWLGMADTSGAADTSKGYDHWLSTEPLLRVPFTVVTPDRRFPQGTNRTAQSATPPGTFTATPYFRNRPPSSDQPGDPLGISQYDFFRSRAFRSAGRIGNYPVMTAAEIRLLAAEAYLRLGGVANLQQAVRLINVSRVGKGQLPPLDTLAVDAAATVPGGTGCVPRVPDPAAAAGPYKAAKCGNIWDALKWEYRMETAYVGYGMWFFAGRGWGDLPEGTALNWPVPNQEMDARSEPFYGTGGPGGRDAAGRGHYGLFPRSFDGVY